MGDEQTPSQPLRWMGRASAEPTAGGCHRCHAVQSLLGTLGTAPAAPLCTDCQAEASAPAPKPSTIEEKNHD